MKIRRSVAVAAVCVAVVVAGGSAYGHPPANVSLEFAAETNVLTVKVEHGVADAGEHFVKQIEVSINKNVVAEKSYDRQTDQNGTEDSFTLEDVVPGEKIVVEATCNMFGSRTEELVVPADPDAAKKLLKVGQRAPAFSLKDQDGKTVKLAGYRGQKNVVLVFYPRDNTPGCTKQFCTIRDEFSSFKEADTVVFGINPQDAKSHKKFVEKHKFPFPLLVDKDKKVVAAYGCKGRFMTTRTVYAISKDGVIVLAKRGMPSNKEILQALKPEKSEEPVSQ